MICGTSSAERFDIYEPVKILWFAYVKAVVCDKDDLVLDSLFDFKRIEGLEYWGDVKMFGGAGNGTCKSNSNVEGA